MTSSDKRAPRQVPPPPGTPARPAGGYSRFIPREELDDFASWMPDAFAGFANDSFNPSSVARAAAAARAAPPVAPPPPEPELEPELPPPPTEDEWLAQVAESRQHGYQDGYRDGLAALEAAKRQYASQVSAQVAEVVAAFDTQIRALEQRMADAVAETAVALARQVVRAEIRQHPQLIAQVAQQAVEAVMLSARHLRLRLNPQDLSLVEQGAGDALRARDVLLYPDAAIERGGCLVESDLGQVDARIERRWAQAAAVFNIGQDWAAPETATATEPAADPAANAALSDEGAA